MKNAALPLGAIIVLAVAGWLALSGGQKAGNLPADGWRQYENERFSIALPPGYIIDESYVHDVAPNREATGVAFIVDPRMAAGTTLAADTRITVEIIPALSACNPGAYLDGTHPVVQLTEDGKGYALATSSGAGAGNLYEEYVYVRTDNRGPCPAVRYYIHSTSIGNYPEGTVTEYNREQLIEEFDKIRLSLKTK